MHCLPKVRVGFTVLLLWGLCLPRLAAAAVLTVGPDGEFASLQAALDAALSTPQDDEIRLRTGVFRESVVADMGNHRLAISGAWDAGFASFNPTGRTTIDGEGLRPVLSVDIRSGGGALTLERIALANGRASEGGGGLNALLAEGRLELRDCTLRDNVAATETGGFAWGGGALIALRGGAFVVVERVAVVRNVAKGVPALAAGMAIVEVEDQPGNQVLVAGSQFTRNEAVVDQALATGVGLYLDLQQGRARVFDNVFRLNRHSGNGQTFGAAMALYAGRAGVVEARRNRAIDQEAGEPALAVQVHVAAQDRGSLLLTDSEVGRSEMGGIFASAVQRATLRMVNLTVADNRGGPGVFLLTEGNPALSLANSIIFGNLEGLLVRGTAASVRNLVGRDPSFVNRARADYRLRPRSRARNAGTGNPPGGLGTLDVARRPRVRGAAVDQGANEVQ
jgi:hypothetical protein